MNIKRKSPAVNGAIRYNSNKRQSIRQDFRKQVHSFSDINKLALPVLPALLSRWLPNGVLQGHEYTALNPRRADNKLGSFKVNVSTGYWCDFATGDKGGDVISLAAYLSNIKQREALYRVAEMLWVHHD